MEAAKAALQIGQYLSMLGAIWRGKKHEEAELAENESNGGDKLTILLWILPTGDIMRLTINFRPNERHRN